MRSSIGYLISVIIASCSPVVAGCDGFIGPATAKPPCPLHCLTGACCDYDQVCTKYADRPCGPPELMSKPVKKDAK